MIKDKTRDLTVAAVLSNGNSNLPGDDVSPASKRTAVVCFWVAPNFLDQWECPYKS